MRRAAYLTTALFALSLAGFSVWSLPRRIDERASERYERQLRTLLALDFRLTAEVLKARSGVSAHYDGIVQTAAARKRAYRSLRVLPSFLQGRAESEIRYRLEEGERLRAESERILERFKGQNAILRNSLRFLPVLAAELDPIARTSERGMHAAQLIRDGLLLQNWQDAELMLRISTELGWLENQLAAAPANEQALLASVLAHAQIVYERTPIVQELTRDILAHDGSVGTQAMMAAFTRSQHVAQEVSISDSSIRFALAMLLLAAAAASVVLRMRHATAQVINAKAQLERAVESLRIEQAKQKELSDLKSKFVSMVSHQFRTPLSVIMSSTEMLEAYGDRWSDEKKLEHFGRLRYEALEMSRMLEAILTIGSHEKGLLKFDPRPLEIDPFCGDVLAAIGDATGQRDRVVYHGTGSKDAVLADPTLLRQMLENLLTNALKYSSRDTDVELTVALDEHELRFEVNDHGIGIDREDLRQVFETFYRGRNVGSVSGTGLGLSIVRGAVELHGGQVAVRSQPDVGTSFMISIPCVRSPA
jgi:signal transduction histidine kinase